MRHLVATRKCGHQFRMEFAILKVFGKKTKNMPLSKYHWKVWTNRKLRRREQKQILNKFARLHHRQDFGNLDTFHRAMRPCEALGIFPGISEFNT